MYLVRGVWGIGHRSVHVAVKAERDTVGRGRFLWTDGALPGVARDRFPWADGALPRSYGRDAREGRLELYRARPCLLYTSDAADE